MKAKTNAVGEVMPKKTMILRVHAGKASAGGFKYEMSNAISGQPIVQSKRTGKWFVLGWEDILSLAVKAGINKK